MRHEVRLPVQTIRLPSRCYQNVSRNQVDRQERICLLPYKLKLACAFIEQPPLQSCELCIHMELLLSANEVEHPVQLRFIVPEAFCCVRASLTDLRSV